MSRRQSSVVENESLQQQFQLEDACTEFESNWNTPGQKSIPEMVASVNCPSILPQLVEELVVVECELRHEAGEVPKIATYLAQLPEYRDSIESAFASFESSRLDDDSPQLSNLQVTRIGDYRILSKLGRGGMGVVYKAVQESLDRLVAIKTLAQHPVHIPEVARRFRREARAIARLHHTNIVNVYGSGVHQGVPYFAMQLVDGKPLSQIIQEARSNLEHGSPTTSAPARRLRNESREMLIGSIGVQAADALDYAHRQGILHRDIKPSNLLLDDNEGLWVTDFGLAKMTEPNELTVTGDFLGTIRFAAPETIKGQWDPRSDVYSLGASLYQLVTFEQPYEDLSTLRVVENLGRASRPKPLKDLAPGTSKDLITIIEKAMQPDPASRYQSADALRKDLNRFLAGEPVKARPTYWPERAMKWSTRNPVPASMLGVIIAMCVFGIPVLSWLWISSESALEFAQAERAKTKLAETAAIEAQKLTDIARAEAVAADYGTSMQLAQKHIREQNSLEARRLLDRWNPTLAARKSLDLVDRRGWEWTYLNQLVDQSEMTLSGNLSHAWYVKVSPDDKQIAGVFGGDYMIDQQACQGEVLLWDATVGDLQNVLREEGSVISGVDYHPSNGTLATISFTYKDDVAVVNRISIWSRESGRKLKTKLVDHKMSMQHMSMYGKPIPPFVQFAANGKFLLTGPKPLVCYDAKTLRPLWTKTNAFTCNPGQQCLSLVRSRQLEFVDYSSGKVIRRLSSPHPSHSVEGVDDESILLLTHLTKGFTVFRDHQGEQDNRSFDFPGIRCAIPNSVRKEVIVSGREPTLRIIDATTLETKRQLLGHSTTISHADIFHSGDKFVTSSFDGTLKIWNLQKKPEESVVQTGCRNARISDFCFRGDDKVNVVIRQTPDIDVDSLQSFSIADSHSLLHKSIQTTEMARWPRNDFAFSPCGRFVVAPARKKRKSADLIQSFASPGKLGIWNAVNGELLSTVKTDNDFITSVCWNEDSTMFALARTDQDSRAILQRYQLGKNYQAEPVGSKLEFVDKGHIKSIALKQSLVAVANETGVHLFDLSSNDGAIRKQAWPTKDDVQYLDFSPDGKRLVAAVFDRDLIRCFDISSSKPIYERDGPRAVSCVRFNPDGTRLAASGYDAVVYLCDADTGNRLLSLQPKERTPAGTFPIISRVHFSPDGSKIAANDWLGRIIFWDAGTSPNAWNPVNRVSLRKANTETD